MPERPVAPDAEIRAAALDPTRSCIVQAPAGSGKTELLIQRLLRLLTRVDRPEEIVAITFTVKAAAEMRERVLRALQSADLDAPADPHARATWQLAQAVLSRDRECGWNLLQHPARLPVFTIDALCANLARRMPVTSGLGALPGVTEDALGAYREAARLTLFDAPAQVRAAWRTVLAHLDNNVAAILELVALMLSRRDQWLGRIAGRADDTAALRESMEDALHKEVRLGLAHALERMPPVWPRVLAFAEYADANLRAAGKDSPYAPLLACGVGPSDDPALRDAWRALCHLFLSGQDEWRRSFNVTSGFPSATGAAPAERRRRDEMKAGMQALVDELSASDELHDALKRVRSLPAPRYDDDQWAVVEALLRLLPHAVARLRLVFAQMRRVDFGEVQLAALQALGNEDDPTDLLLALDHRLRHILVDEFQDTSASQYKLLERLTAGWEPGDGRTLFLVGDPMQSIYRFREAEVGLYLQARVHGIGSVALDPLTLRANFRSQAGLVDWINERFARLFPPREDVDASAVPFAAATAILPAREHAVTLHRAADLDAEAQIVLAAIRDARERDAGGTVAVLVRTRQDLARIVPALRRAGIAFQAVDIDALGERPFIADLMALTFALLHRADRLSWLAVLRAPWCALSLPDLTRVAEAEGEQDVWSSLRACLEQGLLSAEGALRAQRLIAVISAATEERGRLPLARRVRGVWLGLGGPACLASRNELHDAQAFFALLDEHATGGDVPDRDLFQVAVENLYAAPDANADASLQLMTMHKAKGLEWDTVILPGLARSGRRDDPPLLRWRAAARSGLVLAPIKARGGEDDAIYDYLGVLGELEQRNETTRLLYVAMTRARSRVHLCAVMPQPEEGRESKPYSNALLGQLWPAVSEEFTALPVVRAEARDEAVPDMPGRLAWDWQPPPVPAPIPWSGLVRPEPAQQESIRFDWARESARHVGTLVHRVLLQIGRQGMANWSAQRIGQISSTLGRELTRLGVPPHENASALAGVTDALLRLLEDPRGRWLYGDGQRDAEGEVALSAVLDGTLVNLVLDRTFVDAAGRRWIVDFKTSRHQGGELDRFLDSETERYRGQLETYARVWQMREPGEVWLGLYFPLLRAWREWKSE